MYRLTASFVIWCALSIHPLMAQKVQHPLDPLTFQEYWTVLEVLRDAGHVDEDTRFSMVNLKEPLKDLVWDWKTGDTFTREAFAIVRQKPKAYEAVVDLSERQLTSWTELKDVQPNWLSEEHRELKEEIKKHPDFIEAMKKRGITDFTFIECGVGPPGYYGTDEQKGRRIGHASCRDVRDVRNRWTRGIEGLTVIVELNEEKVLRVVDEGITPLPDTVADYDQASIGEPREAPSPMRVDQPLGPGFDLEGNIVEWQNWRFHVRPDQRFGMIVSTVTYQDGERERPILYQGYLSEMFVPYMDPAFAWYHRNFMDMGEFSHGGIVKPLLRGLDCPDNAIYFDGLIAQDNGRPKTRRNLICLFEREPGDMSWRHYRDDEPESRRKRDLIVRAAAVAGNYDYIFDWIFQQDGSIRVRVGLSGIAEAKVVREATVGALSSDSDWNASPIKSADAYGRFVDKHVVAVNHDHYFSFRLDLDVDGTTNSLVVDRLVTKTLPADHPRRSIWVREPMLARTEAEARLNIDLRRPVLWRVTNPARTNHVGYLTSYQLLPGRNASTLLTADDYPRRRAGFIDHHLWVTPYRPEERFAAGRYPTLSEPGQGLPQWSGANRPIENTDIVLWHTVGMHHMVRAEDWPVMPVLWRSFELRPFDFFDRNPALDIPRDQ